MIIKIFTISLPEELKTKADNKAKSGFKNFSEYVKDLIIDDLKKGK